MPEDDNSRSGEGGEDGDGQAEDSADTGTPDGPATATPVDDGASAVSDDANTAAAEVSDAETVSDAAEAGVAADVRPVPAQKRRTLDAPPPDRTGADMTKGRLRDTIVLVIGLLTALNLIQYKFFENVWSKNFAIYNAVFLSFLTVFMAIGLILFLAGIKRIMHHSPRKLALFIAGIVLASISIGALLYTRQGGVLGLLMGIFALISLILMTAGQFEVTAGSAAGVAVLVAGLALITVAPVHEAFLVAPYGDLLALPNILLMAVGALVAAIGLVIVLTKGGTRGGPTAYFGLWMVGVMALFLVPFHEASGINSNGVYGILDQSLFITGAIGVILGVLLFLRKGSHDRGFADHLREGDRLYVTGDYDKAIERYDMALGINPEYDDAWIHKGSALERLGKHKQARKCIERAIELNPESPVAYSALAAVQRKEGEPEKALKSAEMAIGFDPDYEVAWTNKGNALADLKRMDEAMKAFDSAVRINPDYDKAWYNKGLLLLGKGKFKEALECFDETLDIAPRDENALRARETCYRALGARPAEA